MACLLAELVKVYASLIEEKKLIGLPVVRNKTSGHGQGSTVTPISDEFVKYALNLAAINIVLLVGIYKLKMRNY